MTISSSTNDGFPVRCEICGTSSLVDVSRPPGDSVCPQCGAFVWVKALVEITRQYQFVPDLLLPEVAAQTRDAVILEMVRALAADRDWTEVQVNQLNAAIVKREQLGSTGIDRGFAVPHACVDWIADCTTAMAFVPGGADFDSLDRQPVHTVIMLASPTNKRNEHLRNLERISRSIRSMGG